ncbi:nitrate reductase molybdenum cofactor assembly chaperone [Actinophytocola sp.]|uniref:nitrate reductase molybdenum cofactor assembly chaperone n=1 Tax=Actinophytocola sp. TaxID=1872138 RepID=UPI002D80B290|nr:nitrate reductase molybdenum cofactor assembly chaperone [Actinophytocola sp.]HET9141830.1 nitrate reductase molybdenum cofactor assembly chaperone [Actinophytocola sp.]
MIAERDLRLTHLIASAVLSYPDEELLERLPALRAAAATLPAPLGEPLGGTLSYLDSVALATAEAHYVETFDLRRRCCLYLSYYTHGDTRMRGLALLRFRRSYQAAGLRVTPDELPDHLAVVLEFSAAGQVAPATRLLIEHRPGLELLWRALAELGSPYSYAVRAVRASLPPPGPDDLAAAGRLAAEGPPTEQVGIPVGERS